MLWIQVYYYKADTAMNRSKYLKQDSVNSENNGEKVEETVVIASGAKIHRANILARIVHSLSLYKMDWGYKKIKCWAGIRKNSHRRMGLAINRIFRRNAFEQKFHAMQKIKQQLLVASEFEIRHSEKIINSMCKASKSIIFLVLKTKRREIISSVFQQIKQYSIQSYYKKRSDQRRALRVILSALMKHKRLAFDKIYSSRVTAERKQKLKNLITVLFAHRKQNLSWGVWKLRKNLLQKRRQQVQNDIRIFQSKINNNNDPQIQAIKQKKGKLEEHLNKIQKQKNQMQQSLMSEHKQLENIRKQIETKIFQLQTKKQNIQAAIEEAQKQINAPYSLDEIYQCVYHNFLLYLHENKEKVYNKEEILQSLTYPLIPIDVPIDTIKQQNQVMQELLSEYLVMFGSKKLEAQVQLPYQYLIKENQVMYKMLMTLLPQVDGDRDDLRNIRDSLFKLNSKVKELWAN